MNSSKQLKTVIIGDSGVGKTCIAYRATNNDFIPMASPTVGSAHMALEITVENKPIKFNIWDTAGQDEYRSLVPLYFQNAVIALLVFDLTTYSSFKHLREWAHLLREKAPKDIHIVVVGNKLDMEQHRQVQLEEAINYAMTLNATYMETSALTGQNVQELFMQIGSAILNSGLEETTVKIAEPDQKASKRGCC